LSPNIWIRPRSPVQDFGFDDKDDADKEPSRPGSLPAPLDRDRSKDAANHGRPPATPDYPIPRHRRLSECTDSTQVLKTTWELDAEEQQELVALFPRAAGVIRVEIGRYYKPQRWVHFLGLKPLEFSARDVSGLLQRISPVARAAAEKLADDALKSQASAAIEKFAQDLAPTGKPEEWASRAEQGAAAFRQALAATGVTLPDPESGALRELEELAAKVRTEAPACEAARNWVLQKLPIFVYLDEYPELSGHQNVAEYLLRKGAQPSQLTPADHNFEKMCKVAGLDPAELHRLRGAEDHETRNQLANRAGAVLTQELRRLWRDRQLKVRFGLDADHLDTFVSDPNSVYDVEANLDERSRGLKWFFSFYITFAADTKGGSAENAVLLLDEPGACTVTG
jgi:hypothetical protein